MTFTTKEQEISRDIFVNECRQKAWSAACHVDWIAKNLDELLAEYEKLQLQDRTLEEEIDDLGGAIDSHTVDNRNKRKAIQERRDKLAKDMQVIAQTAQEGTRQMETLHSNVETNLALAKHAEGWEWKESNA